MKEWKYRRMTFYSINFGLEEGQEAQHIHEESKEDSIDRAINYFKEYDDSGILYYPAKSYAVAIIYADLLRKNFGGDFYSYLEDPELLDRDNYYIPYAEDPATYETIMSEIDIDDIDYSLPNTAATKKYFEEEFLLLDNHISFFANRV